MDDNIRKRVQLDCLYEMFRDRIEENVVYIVYSENEGKIDTTIDQLMSISSCSFTGHHFEPRPLTAHPLNSFDSCKIFGQRTQAKQESPNAIKQLNRNTQGATLKQTTKEVEQVNEGEDADETGLDIEARIQKLQESIDSLLTEKNCSHDTASQYHSKRMYAVSSYYSGVASQIRKMIEDKTNQLVDLLLQKSQNSNQIDLHGLNLYQARLVVSELLDVRQRNLLVDKQGHTNIDIITGWGKHSATQGHRIRPSIIALLREKGFEYQHLNKGALRVTIRK